MVKEKLVAILTQAASEAQQLGKIPSVALPEVAVERPQNPEHGDYASSLPLKLARATGVNPLAIAEDMVGLIAISPEIDTITVAPPGFINFTLKTDWLTKQVNAILEASDSYGNIDLGRGRRVQLEFVSVNPTGPLHVGHGRGAILGDALARVLAATGYNVAKEYYINDAGSQIDAFYRSLYARYQQCLGVDAEVPSDGYLGDYMVDLAREVIADEGDRFLAMTESEVVAQLGQIGLNKMLEIIRSDLEILGVVFDVWFSERSLFQSGQYQTAMSRLRDDGHIAEKEGAIWFVSTALGEDKDNVVVRGDGSPTYFASDLAYHYDKFLVRKFDEVIDIWGADHQGHVSRMKAVVGALGIAPERLKVIISQCRFFFLSRSADSQMDFDLELAKKQSADNPVYYVQYAHARIASILRLAQQRGIDYGDGDVSLLTSEPELALIRKMLLLPEIVEVVTHALEPHHLAYYAQDLATVFHSFYTQCRVVSQDDEILTKARLKLVAATKLVLAKTLHLMGMTAPEKM